MNLFVFFLGRCALSRQISSGPAGMVRNPFVLARCLAPLRRFRIKFSPLRCIPGVLTNVCFLYADEDETGKVFFFLIFTWTSAVVSQSVSQSVRQSVSPSPGTPVAKSAVSAEVLQIAWPEEPSLHRSRVDIDQFLPCDVSTPCQISGRVHS